MRKLIRYGGGVAVVMGFVAAASLAKAAEVKHNTPESWSGHMLASCCFGGDIRIREVHFNNIPIIADPPGYTRGGENHFFRFRTRLWGQYVPRETFTIKGRLVNEFRYFADPDMSALPDVSSWAFPDELIVDKLYVEWKDLLNGKLMLKIGRQDLIYGTGKVILEGTPKDGSRTIYFDAVRAVVQVAEKCTVDVLGIYNQSENVLSINDFNGEPDKRDVTGYDKGYNDNVEAGGGLYLKNQMWEEMPFEAYYLYKDESSWDNYKGEKQPGRSIHTVGARLMPKLSDAGVDANLEFAYQFGDDDDDNDLEGSMFDGVINWHLPVATDLKMVLGVGYYYLSGDDPNTSKDEGWDPLWARWPQYSELYVYAWDAERAGWWSNLSMPHVDFSLIPWKGGKLKLLVGQMSAPEDDGPGDGDTRGILATARLDFTLAKGLLRENDRLFGHLTYEYFDPDDYYQVDRPAHFARWELSYVF